MSRHAKGGRTNEYLARCLEVHARYFSDCGRYSAARTCREAADRLKQCSVNTLAIGALKQIAEDKRNSLNRRLAQSALTFIECLLDENTRTERPSS